MANAIDIYDVRPNIFSRSTQPSIIGIKIPMAANASLDWKRGEMIFRTTSTDSVTSVVTISFSNTYASGGELVGILVNDINYTTTASEERQVDVYVAGWFLGPIIYEIQTTATKTWLDSQASTQGLSSPYSQTLNNTINLEVGT